MSAERLHLDGRGWFFCASLPVGFAYVSGALCHRATPFEAWNDFVAVTLSGPALFLLAAQYVLVPFTDLRRALISNGLRYGGPFFAALHLERIEHVTDAHFALTAHSLTHLSRNDTIVLGVGTIIFVAVGTLCIREAKRAGILGCYITAFIASIGLVLISGLLLPPGYRLHIHHYFWALCLIPFVRFSHPVCTATQAFLVGVYVEGASRWGLDPIWDFKG